MPELPENASPSSANPSPSSSGPLWGRGKALWLVLAIVLIIFFAGGALYLGRQGQWRWLGWFHRPAASGESVAASIASLTPDEKQQAYQDEVNGLQNRLTRLQAYLDGFPKTLTDLDALAQSLTTPQAAFEFVRDQIAFEPYPGVMKGARGTLITRGGNSLDRALLFVTLLKPQGITAKIAHGRLSTAQAQSLLQQIVGTPDAIDQMFKPLIKNSPQPELSDTNQEFKKTVEQGAAEQGRNLREAVERSYQQIQSQLNKSGAAPGRDVTSDQLAVLQDHFWVQASIGEQNVDMDPSFKTATMNQKFAESTETLDPDELADALYQQIAIRMVGEFLQGGQVTSKELLAKQLKAVDLIGKNLRLALGPEPPGRETKSFLPLLMVGDESTPGSVFQIQQQESEEPESPAAGEEMPGAGGNAAGGLGGSEEEPAKEPKKTQTKGRATGGVLGRLYVEVSSKAPHLPDAGYRRVILDRLEFRNGKTELQAGMQDVKGIRPLLIQVWDGALSVGPYHVLYALRTRLEAAKAQQSMQEKARAHLYLGEDFTVDDLTGPVLPPELISFFFSSDFVRHLIVSKSAGAVRSYYERPRLAFFHHGFGVHDWSKPQGVRSFRDGLDLLNEPIRFVGGREATLPAALKAGIVDTALERLVSKSRADFNTLPVFAAASEQKVPIVTLGPSQSAAIDSLPLPVSIRTVLHDELSRGFTVIVPSGLVALNGTHTFGWWSIDPDSGMALGKIELGGGQAFTETGQLEKSVRHVAQLFAKFYGSLLRCYYLATAEQLAPPEEESVSVEGLPAPGEAKDTSDKLAECVIGVICETIEDAMELAASGYMPESEKGELQETIEELKELKETIMAEEPTPGSKGALVKQGCGMVAGGKGFE